MTVVEVSGLPTSGLPTSHSTGKPRDTSYFGDASTHLGGNIHSDISSEVSALDVQSMPVTLDSIQDAYCKIRGSIHNTPMMTCSALSGDGPRLHFKCENMQKIGAFKIRGALNAVSSSSADVFVTHSSGNHAQALALACEMKGKKAVIIMPKNSPKTKINAVRDTYKAKIEFCGNTQQDREEMCENILEEYRDEGLQVDFVHPYDDFRVISGQGTLGFEIMNDTLEFGCSYLDAVVISVGGGGLLSGCATAIKAMSPTTLVIGAEPAAADDCYRSFQLGKRVLNEQPPQTIADSVRTNTGINTFPLIREHVDDIFTVEEVEIKKAMRNVFERAKLVIEPGAAVAVAVAMSPAFRKKYPNLKNVGVVLCGGNVDLDTLPTLIA